MLLLLIHFRSFNLSIRSKLRSRAYWMQTVWIRFHLAEMIKTVCEQQHKRCLYYCLYVHAYTCILNIYIDCLFVCDLCGWVLSLRVCGANFYVRLCICMQWYCMCIKQNGNWWQLHLVNDRNMDRMWERNVFPLQLIQWHMYIRLAKYCLQTGISFFIFLWWNISVSTLIKMLFSFLHWNWY